jgi:hypothetical protein
MAKAINDGTCQGCGRVQRLPSGVLADHGYEISNGWRRGACIGGGHLPYEVSCDLIERSIAGAERARDCYIETAKALLARGPSAGDLLTHTQVYHPELSNRTRGSVRLWELVELLEKDGRIYWRQQVFQNPRCEPLHRVGRIEVLAAEMRREYAGALLRRADQEDAYIVRQKARIADWVEKPLLPRAA